MYVPIPDINLLLVSDSFNENEHFLNNDYHKAINDVIIISNDTISTLITILVASFRNN